MQANYKLKEYMGFHKFHQKVEKKKYIEKDEFLDMVAIAESTPGPIAINAATYLGYKRLGFFGSLAQECIEVSNF